MSQNDDLDPAANTQMFQAFVDRAEADASKPAWQRPVLIGAVLLVLVIAAVLAWLVLG